MRSLVLIFFLLAACGPKARNDENTLAGISDPEVLKYAIEGKRLYENYCANCHQSNGEGLGKLIPPLKEADYFRESIARTAWIMRHGQKGEIIVNGQVYNQAMPANSNLTPLEIAQISSYLYNIWGMSEGVVLSSDIEEYLKTKPEGLN